MSTANFENPHHAFFVGELLGTLMQGARGALSTQPKVMPVLDADNNYTNEILVEADDHRYRITVAVEHHNIQGL